MILYLDNHFEVTRTYQSWNRAVHPSAYGGFIFMVYTTHSV